MALIKGYEIITNLNNIYLYNSHQSIYYSLTNESKGRYYYEYQHIRGSYRTVIGFSCSDYKDSQIAATPFGFDNSLSCYSLGDISVNDNQNVQIKLDISNEYSQKRIGLGIDIDTSHVYFVYNNKINAFAFSTSCKSFRIMVRGAHSDDNEDYVNVYLNDFEYNPPFNAQPWGKHFKYQTCKKHEYFHYLINLFINIIIF